MKLSEKYRKAQEAMPIAYGYYGLPEEDIQAIEKLEADSELLQGLIEMGRREGYLDISPFEGRECAERAVKEWRESK